MARLNMSCLADCLIGRLAKCSEVKISRAVCGSDATTTGVEPKLKAMSWVAAWLKPWKQECDEPSRGSGGIGCQGWGVRLGQGLGPGPFVVALPGEEVGCNEGFGSLKTRRETAHRAAALATTNRYSMGQNKVKEASYTRLCKTKKILTVNGKFPGPTLYAYKGDTIIVNVHNRANQNITIHWYV
ncbi:hypothetical protein RJ639_025484 [Escallonia herrerae]|uniref:Plastocyanin-like domain-containing protein n=1 Tax=Escallonia herrerae TaxID=1293975 RepID=A0AA89ABP6_9ASTE|nr:hypothetical protein RJ639_025484 [Escallonia herrerae]